MFEQFNYRGLIMRKVYLICPVRNCSDEVQEQLEDYVRRLEQLGNIFHFPPRDVKQDQSGFGICNAHRSAMAACDEVHFWWDKESKGSHFDFGMAFMLEHFKPVVYVQAEEIEETSNKSYGNVIRYLS
jgi:hypothetical protein